MNDKPHPEMPAFVAVCAVFCALLPVHPSIQSLWVRLGVPSALGVAILFVPAFLYFIRRPGLSRAEVNILLPFFIYIGWMLFTSVYSPAIGMAIWLSSVRSLAVVLPVMLIVALIAARNPKAAAFAVMVCGATAALHYTCLLITGRPGDNDPGKFFGAIAVINKMPNYQATAFYVGIVGVWALSLAGFCKRYLLPGCMVLLITVLLLGTVGARSAFAGLIVLAVILLAMSGSRKLALAVSVVVATMLTIVSLISIFSSLTYQDLVQKLPLIHRFFVLFTDTDSSQRLYLFSSAVRMWLDSSVTVFIGGGLAAYPLYISRADEQGWYPHNFLLESLAEGGVIAVLPLTYLLLMLARAIPLSPNVGFDQLFLRNFALYSCAVYMFSGGISGVWFPFFSLGLYLFVIKSDGRAT